MLSYRSLFLVIMLLVCSSAMSSADEPLALGARRELFLDNFLIDRMRGVSLQLQKPQSAGVALKFDQRWEGQVSGYVTVLQDGDLYRMYYLERLTFRTDGFAAVHAGYQPGEMLTKVLTFEGSRLTLNMSSSAAGGILVEIQDAAGVPIPGFTLADCPELNTDDLARTIAWKNGAGISSLAGKPVRLRFQMKDADLFALEFVK